MCSLCIVFKIYLPFLLFLFLILSLFAVTQSKDSASLTLNFFELIYYQLPIQSIWLARTIIFLMGLACLASYLFYDYANFLGNNLLKFKIFFDSKGLKKSLEAFTAEELLALNVKCINYDREQSLYYNQLDEDLETIIPSNSPDFFRLTNEVISQGMMSLEVKKKFGFQSYHIVKVEGFLTHSFLGGASKQGKIIFRTHFEKVDSNNDYMKLSLTDIYWKHKKKLLIRFKQTLITPDFSKGARFNRTFYSLTKLDFFPFPCFSNTIHLFDHNGELVPVCYSVYE